MMDHHEKIQKEIIASLEVVITDKKEFDRIFDTHSTGQIVEPKFFSKLYHLLFSKIEMNLNIVHIFNGEKMPIGRSNQSSEFLVENWDFISRT